MRELNDAVNKCKSVASDFCNRQDLKDIKKSMSQEEMEVEFKDVLKKLSQPVEQLSLAHSKIADRHLLEKKHAKKL